MEKHSERNNSSILPEAHPDIIAMLKRIQQQLVFLEKKIDTLIKQPSGRSQPQRPFGHSNRYGQSGENRRFGQRNKPFYRHPKHRS